MRVFYHLWQEPESPKDVDGALTTIKGMKPFQGDDWFDNIGYGETVYFPLHDNTLVEKTQPSAENMVQWRRVAQAVADKGMTLNVHAQLRGSIERFLTEIEDINKVKPIKGLRWTFSHVDQLEPQDLDRLRRCGMSRAVAQPALDSGRAVPQRLRRHCLRHAAAQNGAGQRHPLGSRVGRDRGDAVESVLHARLGGDRPHARRVQGQPADASRARRR